MAGALEFVPLLDPVLLKSLPQTYYCLHAAIQPPLSAGLAGYQVLSGVSAFLTFVWLVLHRVSIRLVDAAASSVDQE